MNLGKFAGSAAVAAIKEWNPLSPEGYERRDRNRAYRKARRKAKRGETLTEDQYEILRTTKETSMIPQGKATYTGAALAAGSPFIGFAVAAVAPPLENAIVGLGMAPAVCAADAPSCVTAGMMAVAVATGVITSVASWIVTWGRNRAEQRHAAELAAAQAKGQ